MTPGEVWTAIGVVCGMEAAVLGAIITFQQVYTSRRIHDLNLQIAALEQRHKEDQGIIVGLRHDVSGLRKEHTDLLLRLVAAEKNVGDAERERNSVQQELRNLQFMYDRLHGGGKR